MLARHMEEQPWPHSHSLTFLNELRCVRCRSIRMHELHQEAQIFMLHAANLKASLAFSVRTSQLRGSAGQAPSRLFSFKKGRRHETSSGSGCDHAEAPAQPQVVQALHSPLRSHGSFLERAGDGVWKQRWKADHSIHPEQWLNDGALCSFHV